MIEARTTVGCTTDVERRIVRTATQRAAAPDPKALATLQARAALAGLVLYALADGRLLICRPACSHEAKTLAEAECFLAARSGGT